MPSIGRRKRFSSSNLSSGGWAVVFVAGTAPSDSAAKASITFTACNPTSTDETFFVGISTAGTTNGVIPLLSGFPLPAKDSYVHNQTIDLMGGEALCAYASTASIGFNTFGVEANNS